MSIGEYNYDLPPELIAQTPAEPRDSSRLLTVDKTSGEVSHHRFFELPDLLRPGDALVFNDTRVFHARLRTTREGTGGRVEVLLLAPTSGGCWEAIARPARRLREGERLLLASGAAITVARRLESGALEVEAPEQIANHLEDHGEIPLPPYIRDYTGDRARYQTVYARSAGSVAAPTAGLHFTPELLGKLGERGVCQYFVTLHVGPGTFKPIQTDRVEDHRMHSERYFVPSELPALLASVRERGGRIVSVGTTAARALESVAIRPEDAGAWSATDIFIRPGHRFRYVDALVTNFHLPRSTLLLLVSALAGRAPLMRAYEEAIRERYMFYSFGDAMLIY